MAQLLIIEDDPELSSRLRHNLELEGYQVSQATDGPSGLRAALTGRADLILLDLMLPVFDGLHILRQIRAGDIETPVIIVTAKGTEDEKLDGFRSGGDDYVVKPFSLKELLSRVRAVLGRSGYKQHRHTLFSQGLRLDPDARTAHLSKHELTLTPKEFDLLYVLVSHPRQALSRSYLLDEVWGEECDVTTRTVDNHIAALRKKIEQDPDAPTRIVTVYKVGYRWDS